MKRRGFTGIGVIAVGWTLSACSSSDVSAGSEGDAVNLGRCYGADCGVRGQSLSAQAPAPQPCGDVVGPLLDRLTFEPISDDLQARAIDATEASDGSVWAIQRVTPLQREHGNGTYHLTHHSADGSLLGVSDALTTEAEHTLIDAAVAIDSSEVVTVAAYSSYAETADSELVERLTLYSFDADLQPVGLPRAFRGVASPHLFGSARGSIWLAGNATGIAAHGVLSRITQGAPEWIQTSVLSSGSGVVGVSGLTVADDGQAAVVAQLSPKWDGRSADVARLGISTFDESGNPLWTLPLPSDYTSGYGGGLGGTAAGNLVVAGVVDAQGSLLVQSISRDGELGWSYLVDSATGPGVDVRRESGRALVASGNGVAAIDGDGQTCRRFSIPPESEGEIEPWRADADYVLAVGDVLTRLRVPE